MAEGWNADTRMADAQLAVTRHLQWQRQVDPLISWPVGKKCNG